MNPNVNHHPRKLHLDPDRDFNKFPAKWDLSSLPEPPQPVEAQVDSVDEPESAGQMPETWARFFADLQLDPYLDEEGKSSKRDCSIV